MVSSTTFISTKEKWYRSSIRKVNVKSAVINKFKKIVKTFLIKYEVTGSKDELDRLRLKEFTFCGKKYTTVRDVIVLQLNNMGFRFRQRWV